VVSSRPTELASAHRPLTHCRSIGTAVSTAADVAAYPTRQWKRHTAGRSWQSPAFAPHLLSALLRLELLGQRPTSVGTGQSAGMAVEHRPGERGSVAHTAPRGAIPRLPAPPHRVARPQRWPGLLGKEFRGSELVRLRLQATPHVARERLPAWLGAVAKVPFTAYLCSPWEVRQVADGAYGE
jgi:hypothetical protein